MSASEEEKLIKRFRELSEQSYQNNVFYFTDFLSPSDAALVYLATENGGAAHPELTLWGGAEDCERVIIRFGNEAEFGYSVPFPIQLIQIEPVMKKFADELSHRDFLGALMNLGIERDTIGDIVVKDKTAYVFVVERIAEYISEHLSQVKHTSVRCQMLSEMPELVKPELEPVELIVASIRMDSILAKLYHLSRNQALELFRKKLVLVNGRVCENNSGIPKENDVIAVRGYGKFIYRKLAYDTKKGKQAIVVERYI
jgi:RNA-binding protein YlmH